MWYETNLSQTKLVIFLTTYHQSCSAAVFIANVMHLECNHFCATPNSEKRNRNHGSVANADDGAVVDTFLQELRDLVEADGLLAEAGMRALSC